MSSGVDNEKRYIIVMRYFNITHVSLYYHPATHYTITQPLTIPSPSNSLFTALDEQYVVKLVLSSGLIPACVPLFHCRKSLV